MNELIEKRRSIRKYQNKEISNEIIDDLLYHGSLAPSAHNKQHWYYVVVRGDLKNQIGDLLLNSDRGSVIVTANVIKECSALILVYNNVEDIYAHVSIGASIQNILLRATELDLGSLWIGYITNIAKEVNKLTNIDKELVSAIAIGYKDEEPNKRPRKTLDEIRKYI